MQSVRKALQNLLCRLLDHRNGTSCIDKNLKYTHDQCTRCGAKLPIAYPYHNS